jgi:hypothetical protein
LKKNFFEIGRAGYQKKWNFALISKMCRNFEFGKRGNIFYHSTSRAMKLHQYFEFGPASQDPFSFCQIQLALDTVHMMKLQ